MYNVLFIDLIIESIYMKYNSVMCVIVFEHS